MALVVAGGMILVIFNARQSVRSEVESTVHFAIQLIRVELAANRVNQRQTGNWLKQLTSLGHTRHLKIDFKSRPEGAKNDAVKFVPDERSLRNVPDWFVWSVAPEPLAYSQIVPLSEADKVLLIQADPGDEIAEAWNEALDFFGLIGAMAAIVFVLMTATVERAFRPVSRILHGLDLLENGQFHQQLPDFPLPEFTRIANAINQTARALENARLDNQSLRQHSLDVREQERQHLARELHDEFGQSLSAIKVVSVSLKNRASDPASITAVESIVSTCDHLFSVLREMLRRLHPLVLDELGLKAALDDMLEILSTQEPLKVLNYDCDPGVDRFAQNLQIHVFRIVQECMTNILKHSGATKVSVQIRVAPEPADSALESKLQIEVSDNGAGFDPKAAKSGFGLRGIRERVEALGGQTALRTAPGLGVEIAIEIPFATGSA